MLYTSYKLAEQYNACDRALTQWKKHVKNLDKDKLIPLTDILDVLGLSDCLWSFRATTDEDKAKTIAVKFAISCADHVLTRNKYPGDKRPRHYLLHPSNENAFTADVAADVAAYAARAADVAFAARAAYVADAAYAAYVAEKVWQKKKLIELLNEEQNK